MIKHGETRRLQVCNLARWLHSWLPNGIRLSTHTSSWARALKLQKQKYMQKFTTRAVTTRSEKATATRRRNMRKRKFKRGMRWALAFIIVTTLTASQVLAFHNEVKLVERDAYKLELEMPSKPVYIEIEKAEPEPTPEIIQQEIELQSQMFGVDTQFALALANCESGFDHQAKNPNSTARGVYQFIEGTWNRTESYRQGHHPFDYQENIREAMLYLAQGRWDLWRDCSIAIGML